MSSKRRWAVTIGVMTGMFIAALEATVVGTAMPTVIASLGGLNHYSWVFSAYLVTSTVTVPVWGKLSDLYGRRLLYQLGIAVFLLGTLLSGLSASMTQLIVFRAIQGLGAGALVPLGMTIIGDIFTLEERAKMQAYFSGVWGLSSVIGPIVGGFITDQISWRWVFFINLPVGVIAAVIIGMALKEPKLTEKPKIDYAGAGLLMVAISLLMLALVEGGASISTLFTPPNILLIGGAILLLILFFIVEKRVSDPIIPFDLFRNRTVSVAVTAGFLAGVAMFGAISFIPAFRAGRIGFDRDRSRFTAHAFDAQLGFDVGHRRGVCCSGSAIEQSRSSALSFYRSASFFSPCFQRETPRVWLYVDLVLIGAGLGLTMLTLLIAVQQAVERSKLGIATSLNQFSRAIGGAFGVAIMGAFLTAGLAANLSAAAENGNTNLSVEQAQVFAENPNALVDPSAKAQISPATLDVLQQAMAVSIHRVFWVGAILSGLAFGVSLLLPVHSKKKTEDEIHLSADCGERMLMAEQTTINQRNQPEA
jgi:EmrB/QacA subfamily drug resistance transporter